MQAPAGFRIRHATPRDRDVLAELFRSFVEEQSGWGGMFGVEPGPHPEYEALTARLIAGTEGGHDLVLVAETDLASPVGFLFASFARRQAFFHEQSRGKIEDTWIRPAYRRTGLGRALVVAALDWVKERGADRVILQVARQNEAGQAFWREMGFGPFMDVMERDL